MKVKETHDVLTDVSDCLQRGLLHMFSAAGVSDVGHQLRNELRPLTDRDLSTRNTGHALRGGARPVRLRTQSL